MILYIYIIHIVPGFASPTKLLLKCSVAGGLSDGWTSGVFHAKRLGILCVAFSHVSTL